MSKIQNIKALLVGGVLRDFRVAVAEVEPWQLDSHGLEGTPRHFQAGDLFEVLVAMRQELERDSGAVTELFGGNAGPASLLLQVLVEPAQPSVVDISPADGAAGEMSGDRVGYELHRDSVVLQGMVELVGLRDRNERVSSIT